MKYSGRLILFFAFLVVFSLPAVNGFASTSGPDTATTTKPETAGGGKETIISAFELPVPEDKTAQEYLGVSDSGSFSISDIQATVGIVEVCNMYCPHCQRDAPEVNRLYEKLQEDGNLRDRIKLIGIGTGNSLYEVDLFREKYSVVFPLFPDQDMSIARMLGVRGTPTFIGIKRNDDGN